MYVLLLVIVCTTIVVLFSQEFAGLFKRIFSIPGAKLLFPLAIASLLVEYYEEWGLWLLLVCKDGLHYVFYKISDIVPSRNAVKILHVFYLFLLSRLPIWILFAVAKSRDRPKPWPHTLQLSIVIWVIIAVILTVYRP